MAKLNFFLPKGLIIKKYNNDNDEVGLFSFTKFIRRMLNRFHVPFVGDCCPADTDNLPVRFNTTAGEIQYYNPETDQWELVSEFVSE